MRCTSCNPFIYEEYIILTTVDRNDVSIAEYVNNFVGTVVNMWLQSTTIYIFHAYWSWTRAISTWNTVVPFVYVSVIQKYEKQFKYSEKFKSNRKHIYRINFWCRVSFTVGQYIDLFELSLGIRVVSSMSVSCMGG